MMLAELIDGDDFRARLVALGIRIPEGACPETCARMARLKHDEMGVQGLHDTVRELMQHSDMLLPSVRGAIERYLLPGLY